MNWRTIRPLFAILAILMALSGIVTGSAIHEDDPALSHITVVAPETYAQCVDAVTYDTISITGVHDPNDSSVLWRLLGQVEVKWVVAYDTEPQLVPGGFYAIDNVGDLNLTISYPPVSSWPVFIDPTTGLPVSEIHVDMSIEVLDQDGNYVGMIGIGPGHDWDVYCLTPPPPPPPGGEGCTPGYWKNHADAWPPTGYSPGQSVESVFSSAAAYPAIGSASLLDALSFHGGSGTEGAARILLRAAVASVLNASDPDVDYPETPSEIISQVNAALASGDRDTMLELATVLDSQNNLGCPLN